MAMMTTTTTMMTMMMIVVVITAAVDETSASSVQLAPEAEDAHCGICHLEVSLPQTGERFPACSQYSRASCCVRETAELLHTDHIYGGEYAVDHCGKLSDECLMYFESEACLYECSPHAGKWRRFQNCTELVTGAGNLWEMHAMPLSARSCDGWYDACKNDLFCVGPSKDFFDRAHCDIDDNENYCRPFGEIYAGGKELCEVMWNGAFVYEEDESRAYPLLFDGDVNVEEDFGDVNHPYDSILTEVPFPDQCDFLTGDVAECDTIDV